MKTTENEKLDVAIDLSKRGNHDEALRILDSVVVCPESVVLLLHCKSDILMNMGRWVMAIDIIAEAMKIAPSDFGYNNIGYCLLQSGSFEEACVAYGAAIQLNPNNHAALRGLGQALAELGRYPQAMEALKSSLQNGGQSSDAYVELAEIQYKTGDIASAYRSLQAARDLDSTNFRVLRGIDSIESDFEIK